MLVAIVARRVRAVDALAAPDYGVRLRGEALEEQVPDGPLVDDDVEDLGEEEVQNPLISERKCHMNATVYSSNIDLREVPKFYIHMST